MEIIGAKPNEQKKKPYVLITSIVVAVLVVVGITVGVIYTTHNQPAKNQINEEQQFQQLKDSFAVQGITYTKEDYGQDKNIINSSIDESGKIVISPEQQEKLSNAYKRSVNKNQQELDAANNFYRVKDMSTVAQVQDYIVDKVNTMLQFIADNYGWPDSGDSEHKKAYEAANEYTRKLDQYAMYKTPMKNAYGKMRSLDDQATELRCSAYLGKPHSIANLTMTKNREDFLVEWYKLGHPSLGKITSFTLTNKRIITKSGRPSHLQAHITSSTGRYVVYLMMRISNDESTYKLFDIAAEE